jgi:hypothetical protein
MRYFTDLVGAYADGADHDDLRGIRDLTARRCQCGHVPDIRLRTCGRKPDALPGLGV